MGEGGSLPRVERRIERERGERNRRNRMSERERSTCKRDVPQYWLVCNSFHCQTLPEASHFLIPIVFLPFLMPFLSFLPFFFFPYLTSLLFFISIPSPSSPLILHISSSVCLLSCHSLIPSSISHHFRSSFYFFILFFDQHQIRGQSLSTETFVSASNQEEAKSVVTRWSKGSEKRGERTCN